MRNFILIALTALIFLAIGSILGFKLGTEKMWANASIYYASPAIYALEKKRYGYPLELTLESCKEQYSQQISTSVRSYARYLNRWESKLTLGTVWDRSTESMGKKLMTHYIKSAEVSYSEISEDEYWTHLQNKNISLYQEVKASDPELYAQFELEALVELRNLKNALEHHQIISESLQY